MGLLRRLRIRHRGTRQRQLLIRICAALALVPVELLGRGTATDLADLLGLPAITLIAAVWLAVDAEARGAAAETGRRLWASLRGRLPEIGVDLRGEPVIPYGTPAFIRGLVGLCALLTAAELAWIFQVRVPLRGVVLHGSYVVWLLCTALLWTALLSTIALSAFLVVIFVHDALRIQRGDEPHRRRRATWIGGYIAVALLGATLVPNWIALMALWGCVALSTLAHLSRPLAELRILWRDPGGRVGAFNGYHWYAGQTTLVWWIAMIVLLAGLGRNALGGPSTGDTPVTNVLGTAAAWFAGPAALVLLWFWSALLYFVKRRDPAAPCPTGVHLAPDPAVDDAARRRA